jgi:aspartate aminotransferase
MKLAARIALIKPSPTLTIQAKANALKAAGRDIIGFGAGEPDFDTPRNIKQAAVRAMDAGFTKYTPVGGIDELKDAVIAKLKRDNGLAYKRSEIIISCGAKHAIFNVVQVMFEEGDEILIPSPYWVSYTDIVYLSGAKPVVITTNAGDGFKLQPARSGDHAADQGNHHQLSFQPGGRLLQPPGTGGPCRGDRPQGDQGHFGRYL